MYNSIVIGAGFYGCSIAKALSDRGNSVLLLDSETAPLKRASYNNQARVHGGYHYPRSYLTAKRSRDNFKLFTRTYPESIFNNFEKIYGIARNFSNVSSLQFKEFCKRIESPIDSAPARIKDLFDFDTIEELFLVEEFAFDSTKLAEHCLNELKPRRTKIEFDSPVLAIKENTNGTLGVQCNFQRSQTEWITTNSVYVCTYSNINTILASSNLTPIPLKHELTEMALVSPPVALKDIGITIMDGPFWSMMPFPSRGLHTLSHVRYTPHGSWEDSKDKVSVLDLNKINKTSNYSKMIADAARFIPSIKQSEHIDSLWEVKTILPRSDNNDSRPILFKKDYDLKNLHLVLGGKIDNIFDILKEL